MNDSGGVDTSIYGNVQQQPNMLQQMSNTLGVANQFNQNKQFQQQFQARQGLGQAATAAIDPATGNFDPNAYAQQLSKNKKTAYMAAEGLQQGLQIQRDQLANQASGLSLRKQILNFEASGLTTLVNNPKMTKNDIHAALADTVVNSMDQNGKPLISAADAMNYIGPQKDPNGNVLAPGLDDLPENPQVLNNWVKKKLAMAQAASDHVDEAYKTLYSRNLALAPDQQVVSQDPSTGRPVMVANVNSGPPETPQAQTGAGVEPVQQGPVTPMKGESPLDGVFQGGQPQGQAPGGNNVQLSLPPGQQEMLGTTAGAAGGRVGTTIDQAKNSRVLQDIDQQTMQIASSLGSGVGPISTEITSVLGKLADAPIIGPLLKAAAQKDPSDTAAQLQILQKYLARRAQLGGQAAGAGTDFTQGLNLEAQPHDKQFASVMEELARYNLALDMMNQGKAIAMQNYPKATSDPAANEAFENKFRNIGNVDVYRAMLTPPDKRQAMFAKMSNAEKHQMILDRRELMKMGAVPSQMTAPQEQGQ